MELAHGARRVAPVTAPTPVRERVGPVHDQGHDVIRVCSWERLTLGIEQAYTAVHAHTVP